MKIQIYSKNNDGKFIAEGMFDVKENSSQKWGSEIDKHSKDRVYYLSLNKGEAIVKRVRNSKKWCGTIVVNGLGTGNTYFNSLRDAKLYYEA